MTHQAKTCLEALLLDLRNNPAIPPQNACAAIILTTRELGLGVQDFREMNQVMRTKYGLSAQQWEQMVIGLLKEMPQISGANAEDLARQ